MPPSTFPVVATHAELFERFDARMGSQWQPFLTQLPGWRDARDAEGRTLLMVALASTKGRHPALYLDPDSADCLRARDATGRSLAHYAWNLRYTFAGDDQLSLWEDVFRTVPSGPNPVSGRGLIVDALLNPVSFRTHDSKRHLRQAAGIADAPLVDRHGALHPGGALASWLGRGMDLWWGCPAEEHRALFDALAYRFGWKQQRDGSAKIEAMADRVKHSWEVLDDLPAPAIAFLALADLWVGGDRFDRGMAALEQGVLVPFVAPQLDRFQRFVGRTHLAMTSDSYVRPGWHDPNAWLPRLRAQCLDQALAAPAPAPRRLRL